MSVVIFVIVVLSILYTKLEALQQSYHLLITPNQSFSNNTTPSKTLVIFLKSIFVGSILKTKIFRGGGGGGVYE